MNLLIIKTVGGKLISHCRQNNKYDDTSGIAAALIGEAYPADSVSAFALCDAATYKAAIKSGKALNDENADAKDFDVCTFLEAQTAEKSVVPPEGVALASLANNEMVVCHG